MEQFYRTCGGKSPNQSTRASPDTLAKNPVDVEFNIYDQGSLQSYLSDLVGELINETPARRDIHNLTLRFSSPHRAAPAQILERLASFMKLAGETLGAELAAVRAGQPSVGSPRDPPPQAHPASASPQPGNKPSPAGLHAVFSAVPRV